MLLVKTSRLSVELSVTPHVVANIVLSIVFGPWDTQLYIVFINYCSNMVLVSTTLVGLLSSIKIDCIIGYAIPWIWYRAVAGNLSCTLSLLRDRVALSVLKRQSQLWSHSC
jgi:ABC-type Co2+ transport system permease subunit